MNSRLFQIIATSFLLLTVNVEALKDWQTKFHLPYGDGYLTGCQQSIGKSLVFDYGKKSSSSGHGKRNTAVYLQTCIYPPAIGSWFLCIDELVNHDEKMIKTIANRISDKCVTYTNKTMGAQFYLDNFNNATKYEIDSSSIKNKTLPIYSPTLPNMTFAKGYARDLNVFYENYDHATYFGAVCPSYH
ncbi:unnamed protein product [Ambrosiozyma monospora]|uniref:Unnamed protein product n=1 Tax=Ambrosiozyma monospora TaxID=43982 RepID=A0ACB5SXG9_AMBMO|nr:unnamed protein product [Ambrosiozyma monospora]